MKTMILTGTVALALVGASLQSARAGDQEWATVGKVLTGVAVAGIIVAATDGHAQYSVSYSTPAYCPPTPPQVVCCPPSAPVVYCPPRVICYAPTVMVYPARPVTYCPPLAVYPSRLAYRHLNRWEHHQDWRTQSGRW